MNLLDELARSNAEGRWGFSQTIAINALSGGGVATDSLISLTVPVACARIWTVHLNGWRFSAGTPEAQPAENGLDTGMGLFARVQFGVSGAMETVDVDYPPRGCSFELHADTLRVSLLSDQVNLVTSPTVAGFVAPHARAQQALVYPTRSPSNAGFTLLGVAARTIPIPRRAVAYRVAFSSNTSTNMIFAQTVGDGVTLTKIDYIGTGDNTVPLAEPQNRLAAYPLNPDAQFVQIQNTVGATNMVGRVIFILDLG